MALGTISGTTPWGGAVTRGISVLRLNAGDYSVHMIGPMALTSLAIIAVAFWLGLRERRRIDPDELNAYRLEVASGEALPTVRVTWRMWVNAALTVALLVLLILEVADLVILFMVAFVIALFLNIRAIEEQQELIKRQAANAVPVMMLVLAAGIFTGIMTDVGLIKAMATRRSPSSPTPGAASSPSSPPHSPSPSASSCPTTPTGSASSPYSPNPRATTASTPTRSPEPARSARSCTAWAPPPHPCGSSSASSRPTSATSTGPHCAGASPSPSPTSPSPS
ncbi:hypothetical protein [Streptomyces sp. CA-132043]|uniref:hypothetical protein n=1 Tax=Streptomyces sp. CA-132043 TaxID=3240048 RepID=UPI003D920FED